MSSVYLLCQMLTLCALEFVNCFQVGLACLTQDLSLYSSSGNQDLDVIICQCVTKLKFSSALCFAAFFCSFIM